MTKDLRHERVAGRLQIIDSNLDEIEALQAAVNERTDDVKDMPWWQYFRKRAMLRASRREMDLAHKLYDDNARMLIENWLDLAIGQITGHIEDLASHGTIGAGKSNLISYLYPETRGETDAT